MDDERNPALEVLERMPPALVAKIGDNPAEMRKFARHLAAMNLDAIWRQYGQDPDLSLGGRIELQKMLNRVGDLEPRAADAGAAGGGFTFTINFGNSPTMTVQGATPPALEGEATVVDSEDAE